MDEAALLDSGADDLAVAAAGLLRRQRPDLAEPPIVLVDMGFSSFVLSTGSGFIVRVARTPEGAEGHARERRFLGNLTRQLPVAVPVPVWWHPEGAMCRYGAMAYRRIDGTPLTRTRLAGGVVVDQLADFLAQLHRLDDEAVRSAVTCPAVWKDSLYSSIDVSLDRLSRDLSAKEHRRLAEWRAEFERHADSLRSGDRVVVHGDFWHDNILLLGERLVGVLDWEAAALADPAVDLAPVWDIDPGLGERLLTSYRRRSPADASLPDRVRLFRIARNVAGVAWCVRNDDPKEYVDALAKVRSVLPLV